MTEASAASQATGRPRQPTPPTGAGAGPIRTCVGCRAAVAQAELVRVAVVGGRAVVDPRRRLPGRGAYLHARPACVAAAGKGLARSLKRAVGKAELDGLTRALLATGGDGASAAADAARTVTDAAGAGDDTGTRAAGDPGIMPPGLADADAVEIGSPSSPRSMSNPRPNSHNVHDTTSRPGHSTRPDGGAERSSSHQGRARRA